MDPLVSLQYLRLNGNQWICDCRARTLWDWFKRFKGSSSELECYVPASLTGKDLKRLKSDDLEGCVETPSQVQTSVFSTKTHSGKFFSSSDDMLGESIPRCCLTGYDKSSIISSKTIPDPSSYNSRQITNNPLKDKENMSKTKHREERTKNGTRSKQSLNDGPLGTLSNGLDSLQPELIENLEPSTAPSKKKKKCAKKPKSDTQCLKGHGSTFESLSLVFLPLCWLLVTMS